MCSNILDPEWNISPEGINKITENGTEKDPKTILQNALNSDLKAIGKPILSSELTKSRIAKLVLQIQKIRNISAPKAKEDSQAAPRMLKLTLTDGESYVQAIEVSPVNSVSRDKTAPGTKLLIKDASIISGFLLLNSQNCSVLGGKVEHLYEKWLLAKSVQQNHRFVFNDGAPPWVAFGGKILTGNQDKPFKSLEKSKDGNNDSEFEQQRKEAIAEAASGAVKKTFAGRVKQNVQQVGNQQNRVRNNDRDGRRGKFALKEMEVVEKLQKPSEKVSLFSFLEDKLPVAEPKKPSLEPKNQFSNTFSKPNSTKNYKDSKSSYQSIQYLKPSEGSFTTSEPKDLGTTYGNQRNPNSYLKNNMNEMPSTDSTRKTSKSNNFEEHHENQNKNSSRNYQQNYGQQHGRPNSNYQQISTRPANSYQPNKWKNQTQKVDQNVEMHQLANNLSRISVSNEFASRSLRQHLNLGGSKRLDSHNGQRGMLSVGDSCIAKYWEDGKMYPATVAAVTDRTYAVQFSGYGNIEEILKRDCFPTANSHRQPVRNDNYSSQKQENYSGSSMEFRNRSAPPRNY